MCKTRGQTPPRETPVSEDRPSKPGKTLLNPERRADDVDQSIRPLSLSDVMRREFAPYNIDVTTVELGEC